MKNKVCDILIVGGGIVGLWVAKYAVDAGLKVILVERDICGAGASGGFLGALLPHLPNSMNAKKKFQFDALAELSELIGELEECCGYYTGYQRCGRIMPIRLESFGLLTETCAVKSQVNWVHRLHRFELKRIAETDFSGWINPDAAPLGLMWENLTAKIEPKALITVLKMYLSATAEIIEGFTFLSYDHNSGRVRSKENRISIATGSVVLTAGYKTYDLLEEMGLGSLGTGIKGQAALFCLNHTTTNNNCRRYRSETDFANFPIIYDDGLYIVSHSKGYCAVGSTTEAEWKGEKQVVPEALTSLIERAQKLCPSLQQARPVVLWAGVRPRSHGKDPMAGAVLKDKGIYVATGGFKISFGIAHRLARAVVEEICNETVSSLLPPTYRTSHHLGV